MERKANERRRSTSNTRWCDGGFQPFIEQQHNIYGVIDFKIGRFDVNAGIGYGLTPGSDRLMAKMIIGTDLTDGQSSKPAQSLRSFRKFDTALTGLSRP
jgi:hypothetical protein